MNWVNASSRHNPDCLANVFAGAGYDTGFIGKWHLAAGIRVAAGPYRENPEAEAAYLRDHPNTQYVPPGPARLGFNFWQAYNFHTAYYNYWYFEEAPEKIYSKRYETYANIDQAIGYIEKHKNLDEPFLLVVAPHPPHPPFAPGSLPEGYLDKIPKAKDLFQPPNLPKENNSIKPEHWRMYLAMAKNSMITWDA